MVKVIVAKQKYDCKHLLGQFVDEQHYDVLVEEDCDVYAPPDCDLGTQSTCTSDCETCDKGTNEKKIIFKFRKNYFSKEEQDSAYAGLREAATATQNRGLAAGPKGEKYPITPEKFWALKNDLGNGVCAPKPIKKVAKLADHDGVLHTSWGDLNYTAGNDYIVRHGTGDYGAVKKDIFAQTYTSGE